MKSLLSICVAAALTLAIGPASALAAPQGPWVQPASDLSDSGQDAELPQITTAPDGTTTAVWRRDNGSDNIAQAATRPPGGSFGTPVDLSATGNNADDPQTTAGPDGTVTAVWRRSNGVNNIIQAATRMPGGSFGAPVDLSATGQSAGDSQITTAPDGTTTVVWRRSNGSNSIVQAATRPPGGSFGTPVDLSTTGQDAFEPQVTTAPGGTVTAVWRRYNGINYIIQAVTRSPGGSFGAPVDLSAIGEDAYDVQIGTAPDGTNTTVWRRSNGSNSIVQAATRPPGGNFGPPVDLSAVGQNGSDPQISAAVDGTATVIWERWNGSNQIIQASTRPPGGSFGVPADLSAVGQTANVAQITAAPDGTATAVWRRSDGSNDIIQSISTAQPSFTLGVATNGSGTVASSPSGIVCGADCAESYLSYTKVTLTATPDPDSKFAGWGGACEQSAGSTCELTLLDDENATASFIAKKAKLKIPKVKPKKPKVKRGKKVKIKVTAKNAGNATAKNAKLCLKLKKSVKKRLKPKGKTCQKLGSLGAGKSKTRAFKLKATRKGKKGKKYKVSFKLTAKGAKAVAKAVKVKVR